MKTALELPADLADQLLVVLKHSVEFETPSLFFDFVVWAQTTLVFRDFSPATVGRWLDDLPARLPSIVGPRDEPLAREIARRAREELEIVRICDAPFIDESTANGAAAKRYVDALLEGDEARASREVLLAVAGGQKTIDVYQHILTPALHEVGRLWQRNEITVAHEHALTNATERIIAQLIDLSPPRPHRDLTVVSAAVGNAQHQIGARMVADAFAMCGWQATFLGCELPLDDVLRYVDAMSVDVIACSATLASDVKTVQRLIEQLETRPIAPVVIVGGRAFDAHPDLWRRVGADAYAATPLMAVAHATDLISHCCDGE